MADHGSSGIIQGKGTTWESCKQPTGYGQDKGKGGKGR